MTNIIQNPNNNFTKIKDIKLLIVHNNQEIEIPNIMKTNLQIANNFITNSSIEKNSTYLLQRQERLAITLQIEAVFSQDITKNTGILLWQESAINGAAIKHKIKTSKNQVIEGLFCIQNYNIQYFKNGLQIIAVTLKNNGPIKNLVKISNEI